MTVKEAAVAEQIISGWNIGIGETALCTYCKSTLGEGDAVTVYAYRPVGEAVLSVARLYCIECERRTIEHPTCGCFEWLAEAYLVLTADVTQQAHSLTLAGVEIIDTNGPNAGERP